MFKLSFLIVCLAISALAIPLEDKPLIRNRRSNFFKELIDNAKNGINKIVSAIDNVKNAVEQKLRINELKNEIKKQIQEKKVEPQCTCIDPLNCLCCIQFEGLQKGCVLANIKPLDREILNMITYGDHTILTVDLRVDEKIEKCDYFPPPFDPVHICMSSEGVKRFGNSGMQSCFKIKSDDIESTHCINYDNGVTSIQ